MVWFHNTLFPREINGRGAGWPPLDRETVSVARKLIEASLSVLGCKTTYFARRATAYRLSSAMRDAQAVALA